MKRKERKIRRVKANETMEKKRGNGKEKFCFCCSEPTSEELLESGHKEKEMILVTRTWRANEKYHGRGI